jgi:hypothetical protein
VKVMFSQVKRFYILLAVLTFAGWIFVLLNRFYLIDGHHSELSFCFLRTVTGYPCPACGIGHGINCLTHLNFSSAIHYNPFSLLVAFAGIVIPVWILIDLKQKNTSLYFFEQRFGKLLQKKPVLIVLIGLLFLANWIWNFIKY